MTVFKNIKQHPRYELEYQLVDLLLKEEPVFETPRHRVQILNGRYVLLLKCTMDAWHNGECYTTIGENGQLRADTWNYLESFDTLSELVASIDGSPSVDTDNGHNTRYELGDFLLIDSNGVVQAVSGNSDFWDDPENLPRVNPNRAYTIVKVVEVQIVA